MEENMRAIILMMYPTDRGYFFGQTDMFLMANGRMDCSTVKV